VQANKRSQTKESASCCAGLKGLLSPRLFKALSDPKRLSLLIRMAEQREPCTVSLVAEGSDVDMSVVSRHLGILRDAGIIECQKSGKEVWCSVKTGAVAKVLRDLADALDACCPSGTCPPQASARKRSPARKAG
jgi:ArsR family transcriptional regulator, arsenate/arsenite/antimonite-responsive transcriptional repressor